MSKNGIRRPAGLIGAIVLIVIGLVLLLLKNEVISPEFVSRWWPLLLVAVGAWLLVSRLWRRNDAD
jgi:lipopolysaccharide export LptBFGC system permease protein LptF